MADDETPEERDKRLEKYRPGPPRGWVEFHNDPVNPAIQLSIRTADPNAVAFFTSVTMTHGDDIDDFVRQALEAQRRWREEKQKQRDEADYYGRWSDRQVRHYFNEQDRPSGPTPGGKHPQ